MRGPRRPRRPVVFSLDIGSAVLAAMLRTAIGAPYHSARLSVERHGEVLSYTGSRVASNESYCLQVRPGSPTAASDFEIWLTGRWRAHTMRLGRLLATPVDHEPWPLRGARLEAMEYRKGRPSDVRLEAVRSPPLLVSRQGAGVPWPDQSWVRGSDPVCWLSRPTRRPV